MWCQTPRCWWACGLSSRQHSSCWLACLLNNTQGLPIFPKSTRVTDVHKKHGSKICRCNWACGLSSKQHPSCWLVYRIKNTRITNFPQKQLKHSSKAAKSLDVAQLAVCQAGSILHAGRCACSKSQGSLIFLKNTAASSIDAVGLAICQAGSILHAGRCA